jgi:ribose 5-phosphate isomerase A
MLPLRFVHAVTRRCLSTAAIEQGKRAAAYKAVDDIVSSALSVVGIGSGSTIRYAVDRLKDRSDLEHVVYIPTSFQSRNLIQDANLKLGTLERYSTFNGLVHSMVCVGCSR